MKAKRIFSDRTDYPDGNIIEMIIWQVPAPVHGSVHNFKYRMFYGRHGVRLIGYDNERGKGDHRHLGQREEPYAFTTPDELIREFLAEVKRSCEVSYE